HSSSLPSSPSSVPPFHSLGNGTVEQEQVMRNTQWNIAGISSLKALANKVLERNKDRNKPGTEALKSVPHPDQLVPRNGTNSGADDATQYDALSYEFEERLAIAEYGGQQTQLQAQRIVYLDAFISLLSDQAKDDLEKDWLAQKIQIALATLETQNFSMLN
ncbi:MAG: hypothetical protein K2X02_08765, partial [Alphaproteobacteria bacterium]|nr:hypothetical protein [Alphaproteobacteria bacterium]